MRMDAARRGESLRQGLARQGLVGLVEAPDIGLGEGGPHAPASPDAILVRGAGLMGSGVPKKQSPLATGGNPFREGS